uniref:Uncharacterized protein n=1 Tax=Arundo donax TaxID=35708 RepID=A0A0A8YKY1_ARUDO
MGGSFCMEAIGIGWRRNLKQIPQPRTSILRI